MRETKLILTLRALPAGQIKRLKKFIASPFFVQPNSTQGRVFAYLLRFAPGFNSDRLQKARVMQRFGFDGVVGEKKFIALQNRLQVLLEEFLFQTAIEHRVDLRKYEVTRQYLETPGLERSFTEALKHWNTRLGKQAVHDANYFLECYRHEFLHLRHFRKTHRLKPDKEKHLKQTIRYFDTWYLIEKLHLEIEALNRQHIISEAYQPEEAFIEALVEEAQRLIESEKARNQATAGRKVAQKAKKDTAATPGIPLLEAYLRMYLMRKYPNIGEHFSVLRQLIKDRHGVLPQDTCVEIYQILLNHCLYWQNKGCPVYTQAYFDLMKEMVERDLFVDEKGRLIPSRFRNAVAAGIEAGAFEWVERFVEAHIHLIAEERKAFAWRFNRANLLFNQGYPGRAKRLLESDEANEVMPGKLKGHDLGEKLVLRKLRAKVFYELNADDPEELATEIHCFRKFLNCNKDKIPIEKLKALQLFINMLARLVDVNRHERAEVKKLVKEVEETDALLDKTWLLKCLTRQLKRKFSY